MCALALSTPLPAVLKSATWTSNGSPIRAPLSVTWLPLRAPLSMTWLPLSALLSVTWLPLCAPDWPGLAALSPEVAVHVAGLPAASETPASRPEEGPRGEEASPQS